jgi:hypothetical protein
MAGVDLTNISEYLGHKTLQMTKRYAHLAPDYKRHDFEMLCRRIGAKSVLNLHQKGKLENKEDFMLSQFIDNKEVGVFGAHSSVVEQVTHNHLVRGSNPCGPMKSRISHY